MAACRVCVSVDSARVSYVHYMFHVDAVCTGLSGLLCWTATHEKSIIHSFVHSVTGTAIRQYLIDQRRPRDDDVVNLVQVTTTQPAQQRAPDRTVQLNSFVSTVLLIWTFVEYIIFKLTVL